MNMIRISATPDAPAIFSPWVSLVKSMESPLVDDLCFIQPEAV